MFISAHVAYFFKNDPVSLSFANSRKNLLGLVSLSFGNKALIKYRRLALRKKGKIWKRPASILETIPGICFSQVFKISFERLSDT